MEKELKVMKEEKVRLLLACFEYMSLSVSGGGNEEVG